MNIGVNALQMKSAASYSKAGLSRYAWNLVDALIELQTGHRFTIYTNQQMEIPAAWRGVPNFEFVRTKGRLGRMAHVWGQVIASPMSRRYDAWLSLAHTLPLWTRTPRVLVVHDLFSLTKPELYVARRAKITAASLRRGIRVADRLVAVSHATKLELQNWLGVDATKVDVAHLGPGNAVARRAASEVSDEELRAIGVPFDRYLFMLSTVEPRKNLPRLLEAFARIARDEPNLGLAIGGGKGWESSDVFQMPARLGIADRVKFLGYVDDEALPALFARCEAFVLPSLTEGFGMTVIEAMLLGAPVACSKTGALPEVGGDAAIYFDPTNVDDMAAAIQRRLGGGREEAVARGLQQAAKFDWRETARITLAAVEKAAAR